jgi:sterol 3beta-glucosyltransferase
MLSRRLPALLEAAIQAIQSCGQRAILSAPREAFSGDLDPARFFQVEGIPHEWLFPRMRYIIHHGGAGTTGAAIRAGVPSTAAPFSADQGFWARRIHRLGLGPAAPTAHKLTSKKLVFIIQEALSNPSYSLAAQALGEQARGEGGVGRAIQISGGFI